MRVKYFTSSCHRVYDVSGKTQNIPQWHLQNTYLRPLSSVTSPVSFKVCNFQKMTEETL